MAEIKHLEYTYSKDYREVFEDIANLMFCTELGLAKGVNKRINQKAIESDPVLIDGKWYAYQAKYYDTSTKLSTHKQDLITCVKGAASRNVTDLFLYINKNLPDKNPATGNEAGYIQEIENAASQQRISLHWRTLSWIEASLDMPNFAYIKEQYFGLGKNIKVYYDYVVKLYKKPNTGNELLGEESLSELYMQPLYYKSWWETEDVEKLFDEFISDGDNSVLWIVGEPGHGKTSMCIKAVADYVTKKRYQKARGVFWFRLNPQGIPEMVETKILTLEKVFSWGRPGCRRTNSIEPKELKGSLIFLDGFDELKSSLEEYGISDNQFHTQINQLAEDYHMHIVVTSRTRALERDEACMENQLKNGNAVIICNLSDGGVLKNNVRLLAPLTDKNQTAWINELISHRKNNGVDTTDLERYREIFNLLQKNEEIAGLLEVPILLRMIVQNCFEPSSENRVNLYRDLFNKTLLRQGLEDQQKCLRSIYQDIAFRIFASDDDCAKIDKDEFKEINYNNAYLYQYYLHTPEVKSRQGKADIYHITFLHRSFYQNFLSEFFYEKLKSVTDGGQGGENFLKYLWPRHIDPYILDNLRLRAKGEDINHMQVFKAIDETDAFLSEYKNPSGLEEPICNYDKANNVFWNAISICNSVFQVEASQKKMELTGRVIKLLSKYSCSGILLSNSFLSDANLSGADLSGADLREVDLSRADLTGADLRRADLTEANLSGANLSGANLSGAKLSRAKLSGAKLSEAKLSGANLSEANLSEANLRKANLSEANLSGADMSKAHLSEADVSKVHMRGANLSGANLSGAKLSGATLSGVKLRGAQLRGAALSEADLSDADLRQADLNGATLSGANLREAKLSGANLSGTNLIEADLHKANLCENDLSAANLSGAKLSEADLHVAKLSGSILREADLSGANLSEADLSEADLIRANLRETYLRGAKLSGTSLSGARLSGANLRRAKLSGANLSGGDLIGAKLIEADLRGADLRGAYLAANNMDGANVEISIISKNLYNYISGQDVKGFDRIIFVDEE